MGRPASSLADGAPEKAGSAALGLVRTVSAKVFVSTIGLVLLGAAWQILPSQHILNSTFVTPLFTVLKTWWQLAKAGTLWSNMSASLVRAAVGFGIGLAVALPLGLLIGWYPLLEKFLDPLIELFRNTAALALLPVFILLLGIGNEGKYVFIAYSVMWPILLNTITGVRTVDPLLLKSAKSLGLSQFRIFQKVVLPASVPQISTGIRLGASFALLVLIAAEFVGANSGLGFQINNMEQNFQIPQMYAFIITVSALGVLLNYVLVRGERRLSRWRVN
jgi:NitT/TauT family transport system permease protein